MVHARAPFPIHCTAQRVKSQGREMKVNSWWNLLIDAFKHKPRLDRRTLS
jgi:hypothetical protein